MTTCKACGVPVDGPLSLIPGLLFGVKKSKIAPGYCNKCEDMALVKSRVGTVKIAPKKKTSKKKRK